MKLHSRRAGMLAGFLLAVIACPAFASPVLDHDAGTYTDEFFDTVGAAELSNVAHNVFQDTFSLATGEAAGLIVTPQIPPSSSGGWLDICVDANGPAGSLTIDVLDDGGSPIGGFQNLAVGVDGCVDISALDHVLYDTIRVRINMIRIGGIGPIADRLQVSWTPRSIVVLEKTAPEEICPDDGIAYRLRYSVNFVDAVNLVIYDRLHPELEFFGVRQSYGFYTPTNTTVSGHVIPAHSVYWLVPSAVTGVVEKGTTGLLYADVRPASVPLTVGALSNTAYAVLDNGDVGVESVVAEVLSCEPPVEPGEPDVIGSTPGQEVCVSTLMLPGGTYDRSLVGKNIGSDPIEGGVLYDDLTDLLPLLDSGEGTNGFTAISAGGVFVPVFTNRIGEVFPAIVWTIGDLAGGAATAVSYEFVLLSSLPDQTVAITAGLQGADVDPATHEVNASLADPAFCGEFDKFPDGGGSFDYNVVNVFTLELDNEYIYEINDIVLVDMVPEGTVFSSATVAIPPGTAHTVYYSTTLVYTNRDSPPPFNYLAPTVSGIWSATAPPPGAVTWVAWHIDSLAAFTLLKAELRIVPLGGCEDGSVHNTAHVRVHNRTVDGNRIALKGGGLD